MNIPQEFHTIILEGCHKGGQYNIIKQRFILKQKYAEKFQTMYEEKIAIAHSNGHQILFKYFSCI